MLVGLRSIVVWSIQKLKLTLYAHRNIGVSNFSIADLQVLLKDAKVKPAVNQVRFWC
jgi:diketogulonate reductase-like aldo/keto reductase